MLHLTTSAFTRSILSWGDLLAENCVFFIPSLIRRPRSLCSLWNFAVKLSVRKLDSWGYSVVKVASSLTSTVFDWSSGVTDRQTDGRAIANSALRHIMLWRTNEWRQTRRHRYLDTTLKWNLTLTVTEIYFTCTEIPYWQFSVGSDCENLSRRTWHCSYIHSELTMRGSLLMSPLVSKLPL